MRLGLLAVFAVWYYAETVKLLKPFLACYFVVRIGVCGRRPARPVDLNNNQICKLALLKKS